MDRKAIDETRFPHPGMRESALCKCSRLLHQTQSGFQEHIFKAMIDFENSLKPKPDAILLKDLPPESNVNALIHAGYKPWQSDLTMKLSFPRG